MTGPGFNPTTSWDLVPIWGFYLKGDGVTPVRGSVRLSFTSRVTRVDGRAIYPEGHVIERTIGDTSTDAATRDAVRAAWRATDQDREGPLFDGAAWDARWNVLMNAAVFAAFPASDDPDIVQTGYQVKVEERLEGGTGKVYYLTPLLAQLDSSPPGINLGRVEVPPGAPTAPAPVFAKGTPGGVAALDAEGDVVDADGRKVLPGGNVSSVNGRTGAVNLFPGDVGAQPAGDYATLDEDQTVPDIQIPSSIARNTEVDGAITAALASTELASAAVSAVRDAIAAGELDVDRGPVLTPDPDLPGFYALASDAQGVTADPANPGFFTIGS